MFLWLPWLLFPARVKMLVEVEKLMLAIKTGILFQKFCFFDEDLTDEANQEHP